MNPLAAIYGAGVALRNAAYDRGWFRARRLRGPVVSIGNISVGGAGKTPFLILLGTLLQQRGVEFDVISRGYRRETSGVLLVDPEGTPAQFGDEPLLIARKLGAPVIVGEDRYAAGRFAEARFGPRLHLLDDGFQHRALARDFDVVLVSPADLEGKLLPSGRLREPISALRRASALVVPDDAPAAPFESFSKLLWRLRRGISLPPNVAPAPLAFCGIARPERFFDDLRRAGIQPAAQMVFPDHHRYRAADAQNLRAAAARAGAAGFITTTKDAINLGAHAAALENLAIAEVSMELLDAQAAMAALSATAPPRA